jgi:thymidylate synthase (FAD)
MSARIISYTQSADGNLNDITEQITYCARVSNPTSQINNENNEKLLNYLMTHEHWSPFEMVNICIEITSTRDIIRQILRHRSFSFQEFSQRYAEANLGFTIRETRLQDNVKRQNSFECNDEKLMEEWKTRQESIIESIAENYQWALKNGIAKEQSRCILPEGMTISRIYMNGSLRSWIHYLQIRLKWDTQKEHREVAQACFEEIKKVFPLIEKIVDFNSADKSQTKII